MFKGSFTAGSYTTSTGYLPVTLTRNTNQVFELSENKVLVKKSGIVDVKANIVITASGTTAITAQLYGNDKEISGSMYTITPADGGKYTLTINDAVLIAWQNDVAYATLGIKLSGAATIVGGNIVCEYRA